MGLERLHVLLCELITVYYPLKKIIHCDFNLAYDNDACDVTGRESSITNIQEWRWLTATVVD